MRLRRIALNSDDRGDAGSRRICSRAISDVWLPTDRSIEGWSFSKPKPDMQQFRIFAADNGCHSYGGCKMHLGTGGRPRAAINHVSTLSSKAPMLNASTIEGMLDKSASGKWVAVAPSYILQCTKYPRKCRFFGVKRKCAVDSEIDANDPITRALPLV
jgi:hypothetical protein